MALNAPKPIETEQIQFKLCSTIDIFRNGNNLRSHVNLLAAASNYGLMFIGDPNKPEMKVVKLHNIVVFSDTKVLARTISLPSNPNQIAVSCDSSMVAVQYTQNNLSILSIFVVQSFLSANIQQCCSNIQLSPELNVVAHQLLWNPVIASTLAVVLSNGALGMCNLKGGNCEFNSRDRLEAAKCACWSPKGKQIVVGYPQGKLIQFKPDLQPAKTIQCPPGIHDNPFDCISVQWLSTYQFAVVFLQNGDDFSSCLYIANAPKNGQIAYINYYDICYSDSGPRKAEIFLLHVQPWNLLLMCSANSMECGVLGTTESGELPNWHEFSLDACRLTLPMTKDKKETYPIGFSIGTCSTHQLIINENQIPVMPTVHILSSHGQLVSFDFLNFMPNSPGICSPPQEPSDQSGLNNFELIDFEDKGANSQSILEQTQQQADSSFMAFGATTSTPTPKPKAQPTQPQSILFEDLSTKPTNFLGKPFATTQNSLFQGFNLQQNPSSAPIFGDLSNQGVKFNLGMGNNVASSTSSLSTQGLAGIQDTPINFNESSKLDNSNQNKSKPLYTVQPTFKPPPVEHTALEVENKTINLNLNDASSFDFLKKMIETEIQCFETELKKLSLKSKDVDISIGNMEESRNCTKRLNDLQDIEDRLEEIENFETDIQVLRHSFNEAFTMVAEVRSKLDMFENPELSKLALMCGSDQTNRRQLAKLTSMMATNQAHLQIVQQQVDSNWSAYQDLVKQNSKTRIFIPSLEGIYQTIAKQKDILTRERRKIAYIKQKLKVKYFLMDRTLGANNRIEVNVDSWADSLLSMTLSEQVKKEKSHLTEEKLQAIKNTLQNRKIITIRPQRPERMKSEVILECKIRADRKQREGASTKLEKMEQTRIQDSKPITKPIITKPIALNQQIIQSKPQPMKPFDNTKISQMPNNTGFMSSSSVPMPEIDQITTPLSSGFNFAGISDKSDMNSKTSMTTTSTNINQTSGFSFYPLASATKYVDSSQVTVAPIPMTKSLLEDFNSGLKLTQIDNNKEIATVSPSISKPTESTTKSVFSSFTMSGTNKPFSGFADLSIKPTSPNTSSEKSAFSIPSGFQLGLKKIEDKPNIIQTKSENNPPNTNFSGLFVAKTTSSEITNPDSNKNIFTSLSSTSNSALNSFSISNTNLAGKGDELKKSDSQTSIFSFSGLKPLTSVPQNTVTEKIITTPTTITASNETPLISSEDVNIILSSTTPSSVINTSDAKECDNLSDPTKSIFENLNICKPIPTSQPKIGNIFGGNGTFSFAGFGSGLNDVETKSIVGGIPKNSENSAAAIGDSAKSFFEVPALTDSTSGSSTAFVPGSSTTNVPETPTSGSSVFSSTSLSTSEIPNNSSISFAGITTKTTDPTFTSTQIAVPPPLSVFSTVASSDSSIFGTASVTTTTATITSSSSLFSSMPASSAPPTGLFGGIPKPDPSVFNTAQSSQLFGNVATTNQQIGNIFSGNSANTQIFGGGAQTNQVPIFANHSNAFGASPQTPPSPFSSSATGFGTQIQKSESNNIFVNSNVSQQQTASIFGQSAQPAFGSSANPSTDQIFSQSSPFSGGGSIFGGASANQQTTSPFGPPNNQAPFGGPGNFAGNTQSGNTFGSFSSGGQQSAFASPTANQPFGSPNSSFVKPSPPAFGSPPTFGGAPTFGGGPSFGSGFGGFGGGQASFSPPTQKSNLFETLGSAGDGLSFGNLAQNTAAQPPKTSFGPGSSFSSWRS